MNKKRASELFIAALSEMSLSRMTVNSVIAQITKMKSLPRAVQAIANEILLSLEQGFALSTAFSMCENADFSDGDIPLIFCAEETGIFGETFRFLSAMHQKKNDAVSKLMLCAAYPVFVILLAAAATFAIVLNADTLFPFSKNLLSDTGFIASMRQGIVSACLLLVIASALCVFAGIHFIRYSPVYLVFSLLEFLTRAGVDIVPAMDTAITASVKKEKLCGALIRIKESMLAGCSMVDAFAGEKIFANFLFYVETAAVTGTALFSLAAKQIEKKHDIHEQLFLRIAEPAMLVTAGVYMLIVMRCTVIPLMINYGGIL
ncbi:MAG: hypothetical protein Pg6C_14030 [Treponemataceae bacterium]|nr:MAG: hypothetical protein Pg6C_14030 [Treponemataceae bacterium]